MQSMYRRGRIRPRACLFELQRVERFPKADPAKDYLNRLPENCRYEKRGREPLATRLRNAVELLWGGPVSLPGSFQRVSRARIDSMTTILLKQDIRKKTPLHRMRKGLLLFAVPLLVAGVLLLKPGMLASRRSSLSGVLSLAAEPPIARILADYLLSEPIQAGRSSELHPEVLRTLKIGIYMVKKGDALSTIAQAFDLNMDTIISFNGIKSSRKLLAGSKLDIPNTDGLRYTVMRGDSLAKIAKSHDISLRELAKWNNLESETIIQGQELFVPGARLSTNELNLVLGKLFVYPTRGRLTSPFGYRKSPVTGMREFHQGIDIAGPAGTTIRAAMSGDVAAVGVAPI